MKNYNNTVPYFDSKNDIYVQVTRKHAANIFVANFVYCIAAFVTIAVLYLAVYNKYALFLLAIPFALYMYARALLEYTAEARNILWDQYMNKQEIIVSKTDERPSSKNTVITGANGKTKIVLHLDLTQGQLQQIAQAALHTKSLTINFLESIGLSRQESELLRIEFVNHDLLTMDKHGRTKITKDGERVCKRLSN